MRVVHLYASVKCDWNSVLLERKSHKRGKEAASLTLMEQAALSLIVLPVRSSGLLWVRPLSLSTSGGRNHTDLRWSTPNQTLPHRPMPPSWASNGSPGHPDASPAPTWASSSALLIIGSSRPHIPPFLSLGLAFWEHCRQMCPDEHVLICGPRLMLCQRPWRINSFISLKHRHGENQLTGCF